jgi:mannose-6-phosphate isomerase-like protein (cupin superfamily)
MLREKQATTIRRVVTGHDGNGQSILVEDRASPFVLAPNGAAGPVVTDLWKTFDTPANNSRVQEPCGEVRLAPPERGTVFRMVQFPPDAQYMQDWNEQATFTAMGHTLAAHESRKGTTAGMHKTRSVDYAIVLSGEIWAVMDSGETLLRAGDTLIQRGTNHGWSNRSDAPAMVAFILVDALPLPEQAGA